MVALIASGVIALIIWAAIKAGGWAAANPTIIGAGVFAIALIWLVFYHRRRMAEIEALDIDVRGRFRKVSRATPWPRWCLWCGATIPSAKALRIHNDPDSHCSRAALGAEAPRRLDDPPEVEPARWTATVQTAPAGAVDTLTDDPPAIGAGDE